MIEKSQKSKKKQPEGGEWKKITFVNKSKCLKDVLYEISQDKLLFI